MPTRQRAPRLFKAVKTVRKGAGKARKLHKRATRPVKPFKWHA